jgi:hypothetical protein
MKVRLKNTVHACCSGGVKYLPGQVFEVSEDKFQEGFMELVEEPAAVVVVEPVSVVVVPKKRKRVVVDEQASETVS